MPISLPSNCKVATHHDADGIFSGVLTKLANPTIGGLVFPLEFGDVSEEACVLDMVPINPSYQGIVIDHHPQHTGRDNKYQLYNLGVPTSLAVWKIWRDVIPKSQWWKVAAGCAGDGQVELVPSDIWRACPEILDGISRTYASYGKVKVYTTPVWMSLSAAINSVSRAMGPEGTEMALNLATGHYNPLTLLRDPVVIKARAYQEVEVKKVMQEFSQVDMGRFVFWEVSSGMSIESILAQRSETSTKKTTLVVNSKTGTISMRGVLVSLLVEELSKRGFKVGGHAGYSGGKLGQRQDPSDLLKAMREVKI